MTTDDHHSAPFSGDEQGYDRFGRDTRAAPKAIARARKLRSKPTHTEEKLWAHLRKLPVRFRRQAPVGPYTVDFVCHRSCLVIEVDGGVHNLPEVAVRDLERDNWLSTQGYSVIRFTTKQVEDDIEGVLAAIRGASPLPLDGEGVGGWGGGGPCPNVVREASSASLPSPSAFAHDHLASTPPNPPRRGEGFAASSPDDVNHQGGRALWRAREQWVRDDET